LQKFFQMREESFKNIELRLICSVGNLLPYNRLN
jgi:hypothetical protein